MRHSTTVPGNLHPAHNWAVADAAARLALSVGAGDINKLCWQQDDNSLWILTATTPTWVQVGGSPQIDYPAQNNTWLKAQRGVYVALTSSSASIAVDLALANNFNHTLTENTTLAAPTNVVAGQSGVIHFTQHASAAKTLATDAFWQFGVGTTNTMTTTLGGTAVMSYIVDPAGTSATCSWVNKS